MIVADMPFEPFLYLLRKSARNLNIQMIAVLVAREADCRWLFTQLDRDWASLHDVTDEKVIFVTIDGKDHTPIAGWNYGLRLKENVGTLRGKYGLVAFSRIARMLENIYDEKLKQRTISQWTELSSEEFVKQHIQPKPRSENWGDYQSLGITSVLKALKLSESDVPCIYIELLQAGSSFTVAIDPNRPDGFSLYKGFKRLLTEKKVQLSRINEYSSLLKDHADIPKPGKKMAASLLWLKEWVYSQKTLPEDINTYILNAIDGRAPHQNVYNVIYPLGQVLEAHTFNKLRAHLNRITTIPQHIPLAERWVSSTAQKLSTMQKLREESKAFDKALHSLFLLEDTNPMNHNKITSILFLAADPTNASRIRLGEEFREIKEKLKLAQMRDQFVLELPQLSTRPVDISQALLDSAPQVVHFSGHGTASGALCFENHNGQIHPVRPEALAALFELFSQNVMCVLLNACYSEAQAIAISQHIEHVIGMNTKISDGAAIAFAIGFYQGLGAGRTIEESYKLGCTQIRLWGIPEHLTPVLISK